MSFWEHPAAYCRLPQGSPHRYRAARGCARAPRTAGLLSASFPTALHFVPFFFCAVAMTEYGNMFINLLH